MLSVEKSYKMYNDQVKKEIIYKEYNHPNLSVKHNKPYQSEIIPIQKEQHEGLKEKECSLNKNFFDPSNFSPPNSFMNKLQERMNKYYDNE